jgi:hypothetical protein
MKDWQKQYLEVWARKYYEAIQKPTLRHDVDQSQLTFWFEGHGEQDPTVSSLINPSEEADFERALRLWTRAGLQMNISVVPRDMPLENKPGSSRPPFNAEYVLHLLLKRDEREIVIGDLLECYGQLVLRFNKRRADIWFYKQVIGSLLPLLRRALLRIGALVWLGRILRRLIS